MDTSLKPDTAQEPSPDSGQRRELQYHEAKRITLIGTVGDTVLTLAKISAGLLSNSAALLAEGFHSGADLLFDIVVLIGMRIARKEADADHPYGHGKFEGITSMILAVVLFAVAAGIVLDAHHRLELADLTAPAPLAFWIALFSIVTKEFLYQYTVRVGRRLKSNIIIANAWHHRADSIASLAALLGIGGALMGWPILDPIAAIAVAFFVAKVSFEIAHEALKELTDATSSIDPETLKLIEETVTNHPFVQNTHKLRARRMGPDIMVDLHVQVDPLMSVSEGHQIARHLRQDVMDKAHGVTDVIVHIDSQSDELEDLTPLRAGRHELRVYVEEELKGLPSFAALRELTPYYSVLGIRLEVLLELTRTASLEQARTESELLQQRLLAKELGIHQVSCHLLLSQAQLPPQEIPAPRAA